MSAKVTEADAGLVILVATTLGVKLNPWQECFLQLLFAAHRQRTSDVEPSSFASGANLTCGQRVPGSTSRCTLRMGHVESEHKFVL